MVQIDILYCRWFAKFMNLEFDQLPADAVCGLHFKSELKSSSFASQTALIGQRYVTLAGAG